MHTPVLRTLQAIGNEICIFFRNNYLNSTIVIGVYPREHVLLFGMFE